MALQGALRAEGRRQRVSQDTKSREILHPEGGEEEKRKLARNSGELATDLKRVHITQLREKLISGGSGSGMQGIHEEAVRKLEKAVLAIFKRSLRVNEKSYLGYSIEGRGTK